MADTLTRAQNLAAQKRGGKLLVSAAAGSGKTMVLVERLMRYLTDENSPANLDEFLIITYTKAAAMELRGKIAAGLTRRIAQQPENRHLQNQIQRLFLTQISTVHGFCSAILREYAYRLDIPADFRVADETESEDMRTSVMRDLLERAYASDGEESHFLDFVDSQGIGRNDNAIPDIVRKVYDSARCHLNPWKWLDDCLGHVELEGVTDAAQSVWGKYLMGELFSWLDLQIPVLTTCLKRLRREDGCEKPAENMEKLVAQLESLRGSTAWDEVYTRRKVDFGVLRFPKRCDQVLIGQVKAIRDACKSELEKRTRCFANDSEQVLKDLHASADAAAGIVWLVRQFEQDYSRVKRSRRVLDFSDLEHSTLDLLLGKNRSGPTAAAREIGARFREILVDEYQDSNGVQDAIFSVLTQQKQNCFMVGDVKQSIYRFRLADPGIFLEKYHSFGDAETAQPGEPGKILLSQNFRSGGEIISAVNDVFSTCMSTGVGGLDYTQAEALQEGVPHVPLGEPAVELHILEICDGDSYGNEAAFTARRIREMLDSGTAVRDGKDALRPVRPEDIVLLLRSPGTMAEDFRAALEAQGVRCALDGGASLMDTPEVSTLHSLLQTVANPRQDIPLLSTLASPIFGFTADDLAAFRAGNKRGSIYDALCQSRGEKTVHFLKVLNTLRQESRLVPLTQLLQDCFAMTRLDSIFGAMPGGKARKENLQLFYQMAVDYEQPGLRTLSQFLEHLETLGSGQVAVSGSSAGCVTLMSIHKSKGLEFPVVFLCGLSHRFNASDRQEQVLCDKDLGLGLAVADNQNRLRYSAISKQAIAASIKSESISEELRILYVAMTRAKDRLVMTCTMKNPEKRLGQLANRLIAGGEKLVCMEADCFADWILTTALRRVEAGQLHTLAGRPEELHSDAYPWKISLTEAEEEISQPQIGETEEEAPFPAESISLLQAGLAFHYDHLPATRAPSKQTATGRKGGVREEEAQEDTYRASQARIWREPSLHPSAKTGSQRGTAIHSVMQFIHCETCTDEAAVQGELQRLRQTSLLTQEQLDLVDAGQIAAFFQTPIGRKLRSGVPYIREFKFSILDSGEKYGDGLEGEQVLLQGVVDCALLEPDGITVLDFKTDHVTEETIPLAAARYRAQLETYAEALSRIYEMPVKEKYLYFFRLNRFITP